MTDSESTPRVKRRWFKRRGQSFGWFGGAIVLFMLAICLGTMPYTLSRTSTSDPRRYEATDPDRAMLPPFWTPYADDEIERVESLKEKTQENVRPTLGTDRLGRSVLIRCLAGGGISLLIGLSAASIAVIIGTLYGTIAGWSGGRVDAVMMRIVDVFFGLPYILLVVLLAVAADGLIDRIDAAYYAEGTDSPPALLEFAQSHKGLLNIVTLLIAIGAVSWLSIARVIRGQVLSLKAQPFMEACRAIGVPLPRQFFRHLLPNLLGPITVYATLTVPAAILSESFLSFLGIGVQEPLPSWGNLAAAGLSELNTVRIRWWLLFWPCLFIAITLLALNFVGESLREKFDPRTKPLAA